MRHVVVHGHYYQPPREDPWLEVVAAEPTAAPYHDWNARIERECYRAVTAARLTGAEGRIARIENLLEWTSFDVGPTLLAWLERETPGTYAQLLAADRLSRARLGSGNAVAAPYHHVILPLASRRDKVTEVRWGIADFRRRFGREPEGMWLPETAVDDETLDVLAGHGIAFTILAPHQVERRPAHGMAGRYRTGGGREIALFVYDGSLSHEVAFGGALRDGSAWARRMLHGADSSKGDTLVSVATDGETYGHHHRFGEMALARMLDEVRTHGRAVATNFAAVLAAHPPASRVTLVAPSSWSCGHGVERWKADCGCRTAPERGWHQGWRAPLREAVEWLAGELHSLYEREASQLFRDPWAARDAYGDSFGPDGPDQRFVHGHERRPLVGSEAVRARELLELERDALSLFTSCAWFFDDIGGLEPIQVLRYAARAIELAGPPAPRLETGFERLLHAARSNDPAVGDGRRLYLDRARPRVAPLARLAGSWAAARKVVAGTPPTRACCFDVEEGGDRVRLVDRRTGRETAFVTSVQRAGTLRVAATVAALGGGSAVPLDLPDLLERERAAIVAALTDQVAARVLAPDDLRALRTGVDDLAGVSGRALGRAMATLARDDGRADARAGILQLLDLFDLHGWAVPFDVQTAFFRWRTSLPADGQAGLEPLALRLGFAARAED